MKKFIITTTINKPTRATLKFCEIAQKKNFTFVLIGDKKTPHEDYRNIQKINDNFIYLDPNDQENLYPELSNTIGWNTIQRRNIGFVFAYKNGADIVATVDDDNIPYDQWGDNILVGNNIEVDLYHNSFCKFFDPLSVTNHKDLWHRGFPIEYVPYKNNIEYLGKIKMTPLIQAELWDGDPDVDAICRLSKRPIVKFDNINPYTTNQLTPFNSQNTFLHRDVLKFYSVLPFIGRMDDIWGGYILQKFFSNSIVFTKSSVYQERNPQDLITNLENEIIGYRNTLNLINDLENFEIYLPKKTLEYIKIYKNYF